MTAAEGQAPRTILALQSAAIDDRLAGFASRAHDGADLDSLHDAMLDLLMDMGSHFGFEESLMDGGGYPDLDHHRRQHLAMMTELGLLLDRLGNAARIDNELLRAIDFLAVWYGRHAASSDRTLDDWLVAQPCPGR
jgi:hemerythrin-like metal-binding protein